MGQPASRKVQLCTRCASFTSVSRLAAAAETQCLVCCAACLQLRETGEKQGYLGWHAQGLALSSLFGAVASAPCTEKVQACLQVPNTPQINACVC